mmetsp:Transcript_4862/g.14056  ORF Transcript_4862/g.14056 Transcript_4862/m.14056 type:complete len:217 (-) Transcript_4862:370-1020(-)
MILDDRCVLMNDQTTSILSCRLQIMYACSSLTGVGLLASECADTYSGASRLSLAKLFTLFVCVAENSSVCLSRFGRLCRIAFTVALKPISRIRSASSSTRILTLSALKSGDSSICWSKRPGVTTRMFIAPTRLASCCTSFPPIRSPADRSCCSPIVRSSSNICIASSRVGEMIIAPRPSSGLHRRRNSRSTTGMRNARVFPEPVLAAPRTSRPQRA